MKASKKNQMNVRRRGQSMTEYVIIVGIIAIILIPAVRAFKDALTNSFNKASQKIDEKVTKEMDKG